MAFIRKVKGKGRVYYYMVENRRVNGKIRQKYLGPVGYSKAFKAYRDNIGPVGPILAEELRKAELRWPAEWIMAAIREACVNNQLRWAYIEKICSRYECEGFSPPLRERSRRPEEFVAPAPAAPGAPVRDGKCGNFVIGGYTPTTSSRPFRSLVLGLPAKESLRWVGNVGGGFKWNFQPELYNKLQDIRTDESPFGAGTDMTKMEKHGPGVSWVKPVLIAEVKYSKVTQAGMLYQPMFKRLRPDLTAEDARVGYDGGGING